MKKITLLLAIMLPFFITACSGEDSPIEELPTTPVNPKEYIISLGFSGEITNIDQSPLSRAVPNDIYGIQVYSMPTTETDQSKYKPYAHGQFDDKTKMTIKLLEGYKYKFVSTMIVDGKNKMLYGHLIMGEGNAFATTTNAYSYSSNRYFPNLQLSRLYLKFDGNQYDRPNVDRYYGESTDYVPAENGSVSINMKRVVFGVKIITEGLTEGKITISIEDAPIMSIAHPSTATEDIYTLKSDIFSYHTAWIRDDYTETISLSASWEKLDGAIVPLVSQDIMFKRNKLTTITIKVNDNSINNGVDISNENTPMGDGGNITIDAGNGTGTGVDPNV